MNPFDLPGPQFLIFYIALAVGVHVLFKPLARLITERSPGPGSGFPFDLRNADPYLIAYLRGQSNETARVAIISLLDRGLLKFEDGFLVAVPGAVDQVRRPLEREGLWAFQRPAQAALIFRNGAFDKACEGLRNELARLELIPDSSGQARLFLLRVGLLAVLVGVALAKILIAFERGHYNVVYLIMLTIIASIALMKRKALLRTRKGDAALAELRSNFASLKQRAADIELGGGSRDLPMLAAIFGITALGGAALAQAQDLFPVAVKYQGVAGSSCGGSSCGNWSSCSGGSSCGGGGSSCGGGCGGCGG
jgi:uncharacterized protein (TIGR04222 family)